MFRYFRFPMDFGDFVYLSQVQQGLAIKTAVEFWRSLKPHNMGALYWQLNDTWPVASWASLDHGGGWKVLHHMVKRFFQAGCRVCRAVAGRRGDADRWRSMTRPDAGQHRHRDEVGGAGRRRKPAVAHIMTTPPDKAVDAAWLNARDIGKDQLLVFDYTASDGSHGRGHHALQSLQAAGAEWIRSIEVNTET